MKRAVCCVILLCAFSVNAGFAQAGAKAKAKSAEKRSDAAKSAAPKEEAPTVTSVLAKQIKMVEGEFVPAADAMPEDKYDFAPTNGEFKGVRTFGQQVKHVAQTNFMLASGITGEKRPENVDSDATLEKMTSKADIMKYLKDSYEALNKAVATINQKNYVQEVPSPFNPKSKSTRLGIASSGVWHTYDHYGQLVEYLRMNGIIPPASRT